MSEGSTEYRFPRLRPAVLMALTWRVISEVMRRHHTALDLRVHQFYPGLSPLGEVSLAPGRITRTWVGSVPRVTFHLGGGGNGGCSIKQADGTTTSIAPITRILEGVSVDDIVKEIESAARWPHREKQTTTPPILMARLIARFLERYALAPVPYRASSGWLDNSSGGDPGTDPVSWLAELPEGKSAPVGPANDRVDYTLRFWMLHRDLPHGGPMESWSPTDGPAVVLDMATATGVPLHGPARVNFMDRYLKTGHSLRSILLELEQLMKAP